MIAFAKHNLAESLITWSAAQLQVKSTSES